jgi:hypothetical protein
MQLMCMTWDGVDDGRRGMEHGVGWDDGLAGRQYLCVASTCIGKFRSKTSPRVSYNSASVAQPKLGFVWLSVSEVPGFSPRHGNISGTLLCQIG